MQRYRADTRKEQTDKAILWFAEWMGGPSLSRVNNCRLVNLAGDMRRTVYITGESDTWFSVPAVTRIGGRYVRGYVTHDDDGNAVFHHCYY